MFWENTKKPLKKTKNETALDMSKPSVSEADTLFCLKLCVYDKLINIFFVLSFCRTPSENYSTTTYLLKCVPVIPNFLNQQFKGGKFSLT